MSAPTFQPNGARRGGSDHRAVEPSTPAPGVPVTTTATAAAPTANARRAHEPAIVQPGRNPRVRSRVRVQWLALAAAMIVLAGTLVAWALSRAAERVQVVSVSRPVQAGDVISVDDLTISEVAIDADVRGLVPAASLDRLAGRVATIDLAPGTLVSAGMWAEEPELRPDERTVGAVLGAGRFPSGLAHGSNAWAIDVRSSVASNGSASADAGTGGAAGSVTAAPIVVRVLDTEIDETGALTVTLAVPADAAVEIASLAATDTLALAGIPADPVTTNAAATDTGAGAPAGEATQVAP